MKSGEVFMSVVMKFFTCEWITHVGCRSEDLYDEHLCGCLCMSVCRCIFVCSFVRGCISI